MPLNPTVRAQLQRLAKSGDRLAKAVVEAHLDINLTAGAEAANAILVTGQVQDGLGSPAAGVRVINLRTNNAALVMTDAGAGTFKSGSGTIDAYVETDATGKFEVSVAQGVAVAGDYFMTALTHNGDVAMVKLTFA